MSPKNRGLTALQRVSLSLMAVLTVLTFVGANIQAMLWQSSEWLVSTVLPAVVVELTNEERADNLAAPLQRSAVLDEAARLKAEHMARNEYFSHYSPDGVSPWYWFDMAGYTYAHAGENLAIHFTDSAEVVEAWMGSPLHRENIVNGVYTEIGVGTAKGTYEGYDTVYVVQLFGAPAVAPAPVVETTPEPELLAVADFPTEVVALETVSEPVASLEPEVVVESPEVFAEPEPEVVLAATSLESAEEAHLEKEELLLGDYDVKSVEFDTVDPVSEASVVPESVPELTVFEIDNSEVVVIESEPITTSSGLAVAQIDTPAPNHAGATVMSLITQPNALLQMIYLLLAVGVMTMLGTSLVLEARRLHFQQVAYSVLLLFGMMGLWYTHSILTTGAVII